MFSLVLCSLLFPSDSALESRQERLVAWMHQWRGGSSVRLSQVFEVVGKKNLDDGGTAFVLECLGSPEKPSPSK